MSNHVRLNEDQQLLERQRALDSINALALELVTAPEPAVVLRAILEQVVQLTGMQSAECYLLEANGEEKRTAAIGLTDDARIIQLRQQALRCLNTMAGDTREPFIVADLPADANDILREMGEAGYGSLVYVRLDGTDGVRVGSLVLYSTRMRHFSPGEQVLLKLLARQINRGVSAAQAHRVEQERAGHLLHTNLIGITLSRVAVELQSAHTVHEMVQTLSARLQRLGLNSALFLSDGDDKLRLQAYALKPAIIRAIFIASGVQVGEATWPLPFHPGLQRIVAKAVPVRFRNVQKHTAYWFPGIEPERLQRALWVAGLLKSAELALLPLTIHDRVGGVLLVWGMNIRQDTLPPLTIFAAHVAQLIASIRLREQLEAATVRLRELTRQFINVQEDERARISRQLHDEAGQSLTALKIQLFLLHKAVPPDQRYLIEALQHSMDDVGHLVQQMRTLSHEVHPPALDDLGLNAALDGCCQTFAQSHQLMINYRGAPVSKISRESGITMYRFLQEALTNAARHASAGQVDVTLKRNGTMLVLSVRDDGHGFDAKRVRYGIGLRSIRERLELIDGEFQVESQEGKGTRLTARVPFESEIQEEE